jgi:hypothetical protein
MSCLNYLAEIAPVFIRYTTGRDPKPVWTLSITEESLAPPKNIISFLSCLAQCCRTYGTRTQNGTRKDFLDAQYSPLSNFFCYFFWPTCFAILWRICVYVCTYIYMYIYLYISDCVESVYELPLIPNNTASEIILHTLGALRSVDWICINGVPTWRWLGEYKTLDKMFYNFIFKQEVVVVVVVTPVTTTFSSLSHSSTRTLLQIK